MCDFQRRGKLNSFLSRLGVRLKTFMSPHMSEYLMKPMKYTVNFKGVVRSVNNCQKFQEKAENGQKRAFQSRHQS